MKSRKWKESSWYGAYYKWMFNGNLPNNGCVFFWNTLFSIIFLPLTILLGTIALLLPNEAGWWNNRLIGKVLFGTITWILFIFGDSVGLAAIEKYLIPKDILIDLPVLVVILLGMLGAIGAGVALLLCLGVLVLLVAGFAELGKLIKKSRRNQVKVIYDKESDSYINVQPELSKLSIIWNTIRNKYCMKIEWEK